MEFGALLPASTGDETLTQLLSVPTTAFDMANAITATARHRTDVASRLSLEEVGHRYLTAYGMRSRAGAPCARSFAQVAGTGGSNPWAATAT